MGISPDCLSQAKRMTQTPVDEGKASDQAAETSAVNDVPPAPVPPRASGQKSGLILSVVALVLAGGAVAVIGRAGPVVASTGWQQKTLPAEYRLELTTLGVGG